MKYLFSCGFELYQPMIADKPVFQSLVFLRCSGRDILQVKEEWFSQLMVYRDLETKQPQPIPDAEMDNFRSVLNVKGEEIIPLEVYDSKFLSGQKVKVIDGPFKGVVGVIKRVKGNRRLIVSISGAIAVATIYIPQDLLEPIIEQK